MHDQSLSKESLWRVEPRCRRLCADSMGRPGQLRLSRSITSSESPACRDSEAVSRQRQRSDDRDARVSQAARLVVLRHDTAGQAGVIGRRTHPRDVQGAPAESGVLVRGDVVESGQTGRLRRGSCGRLCSECVSENAALTPGDGVEADPIAPGDGVEAVSPTPPDGAMKAIFWDLSTPPDGDPLDMPSPSGVRGCALEGLRALEVRAPGNANAQQSSTWRSHLPRKRPAAKGMAVRVGGQPAIRPAKGANVKGGDQ